MKFKIILIIPFLLIGLVVSAQFLVRPGVTQHKNWQVSAEQNFFGSDEFGGYSALCGYNINALSGKKTGFLSLFDFGIEDTMSYIQNISLNTNVFYSVAISDVFGGSGTFVRPVVCAGYEEETPGDKDILIHYTDFSTAVAPNKSNNDLIITASYDQEALFIKQEYTYSSEFWACGYSESAPGSKEFWLGQINANGASTSVMWDTTFGGLGEDVINSINFYEGSPVCTGYTTSFGADGKDVYIASLNIGSGIYFENAYSLPGDQVLHSASDIYGNIIAVGYSDTSASVTNKDMFIVSFDGYTGNVNWIQTIGSLYNDEAFTVREGFYSGQQNYIVSGYTTTASGDKQNYVVMLDFWGNLISERIFGDSLEDDCINTMFPFTDGCQFYLFGQQGTKQSFNEIVAINYNIDVYNITCNGDNNGEIYLYPLNGYGQILSSDLYDSLGTWISGNLDNYSLSPGKYYMEMSYDGGGGAKSGCFITDTLFITEPLLLSVSVSSTNLDCLGNLGNITATPTGGTPPYSYNWNDLNLQTTATAIDLDLGVYTVNVYDNNGCSTFASQLILQSQQPTVSITSFSDIQCFGANNGTATASATGGTPSYAYLWNDPNTQNTAVASNLSPGSYIVNVYDINGCTASANVIISQPANALVASATSTNINCKGGSDGSATAIASGGTPGYTYVWSDPNSQASVTASNLLIGACTVSITDLNGCTTTATVTITEPALVPSVSISSFSNVSCKGGNNGLAVASASGGTPGYTYLWNDPNSQSGFMATNLFAGIYVVNVTDLNGCTAFAIVTITQPTIDIDISITSSSNVSCFGGNNGSANASVIGGTPGYTFMWNDPNTQSGTTASNLPAGSYLVYVSDVNGCNASTSVTINQPSSALAVTGNIVGASCAGYDGQVQISTSGGTPVYSYLWDDFTTNSNNLSLSTGTHYLTVTDANGCVFNGSYIIPYSSFPATLRGNVTYSGGNLPTGDGKATLFVESNGSGSGQFDTLTYQTLNSAGYEFNNLLPGRYFLKVDITNPTLYPNILNTYYNNGVLWIDADTINLSCNDLRYAHVQMQEMVLNPNGNCDISGNIILYDVNSGAKSLLFTKGTRAYGEPVPGAEILIEQEPNDVPIQSAITNSDGDYTLTNIPIGNLYHLVVDVPGYPMMTTFVNISVSSNDTLLEDYNFILDTTSGGGIFMDTLSGIPEQLVQSGFTLFEVYPNPVSEFMVVNFELSKDNIISIELINELGATVKQILNDEDCKKGLHNYQINIPSSLSAGSYFIRLKDDRNVYVKKFILKK